MKAIQVRGNYHIRGSGAEVVDSVEEEYGGGVCLP